MDTAIKLKRPRRIVLVRHGESEANKYLDLITRGEIFSYPPEFAKLRDWDITLTSKGKEQARKTGEYLKKHFGIFDVCYVSPQQRTKETFEEIVAGYEDAGPELRKRSRLDSRLREKDFGAVSFLSNDEIKRFFPHEYERREREGKLIYRPLGGESWYDVKDLRVGGFLNSAYRDYAGQNVLVVSHFIVINCMRMKLQRLEESEVLAILKSEPLGNCGISVFESDESRAGRLALREWNKIVY